MANSFKKLRNSLPQEMKDRIQARTLELANELSLNELRRARQLTQENLADRLHSKQAYISQIEKKTDMYLSTLRSYLKAMGGDLKLVVEFPDGTNIPIRHIQSV